ncbi:hypothetical protein BJX66DRAFT_307478 [Aspergillus keveii]|uniref:Uncharacterized protein n=1 Tax=Aspergillus keveii TaxID=714993 RepID=A0ABR4G0M3_9EURO
MVHSGKSAFPPLGSYAGFFPRRSCSDTLLHRLCPDPPHTLRISSLLTNTFKCVCPDFARLHTPLGNHSQTRSCIDCTWTPSSLMMPLAISLGDIQKRSPRQCQPQSPALLPDIIPLLLRDQEFQERSLRCCEISRPFLARRYTALHALWPRNSELR